MPEDPEVAWIGDRLASQELLSAEFVFLGTPDGILALYPPQPMAFGILRFAS